ncbi:MAG TPA: hypothetical protein DCX32_01455 [Candidatus Moranbacteria bacterium]|nr:MAG: hypothetical protein UW95_C0007G0030 [Parcubacteria group bacterium GW2011_GWC1_45_14]HAV11188.1 hypothetical protein [Candidatus Moranbacteria bacterium]
MLDGIRTGAKDNLGYSVENARNPEQAREMLKAATEKKCLFCPPLNFEKNKPLNKKGEFDPEGKDWPLLWVWVNPFPQEHHALHLMILPKRHIINEEFYLLTNEEWLQILDAWKWAQEFFKIPGGVFTGRFGLRSHNAGTIGHLHFQLQIPDLSGPVQVTVCKDRSPEKEARRATRDAANKGSGSYTGYIIRNEYAHILDEQLRWRVFRGTWLEGFAHAPGALPHIEKFFQGAIGPASMRKAAVVNGTTELRGEEEFFNPEP